jgi:hypothetical protein
MAQGIPFSVYPNLWLVSCKMPDVLVRAPCEKFDVLIDFVSVRQFIKKPDNFKTCEVCCGALGGA